MKSFKKIAILLVCGLIMIVPQYSAGDDIDSLFPDTNEITDSEKQLLWTALKNSSWDEIAQVMKPIVERQKNGCDLDVPYLFLAGLSFLATGNNNEAAYLLYCPEKEGASNRFMEWKEWTNLYLEQNPEQPIAQFLSGDAYARTGEYDKAKVILKQVVDNQECPETIKPMAYNSLGVVSWIMKEENEPLIYFQMAAENEGFADPWVNLGVLELHEGLSSETADENFNQALNIDDNHSMALNGRACAAALAGEPTERVKKILEQADNKVVYVALNKAALMDSEGTPFETSGVLGQHRVTKVDFDIGIPGLKWLGSLGFELGFGNINGGVYTTLKEGENLETVKEGKTGKKVGTWFALNYPMISE